MKKIIITVSLFCLSLASISINTEKALALDNGVINVVEGNNNFAFDLYAKLREQEGNLFFSPYSISMALAMTYAGARGNTAEQMSKVLHFNLQGETLHDAFFGLQNSINTISAEGRCQFFVANALWGQEGYPFVPSFMELVKEKYSAGISSLDFIKRTEDSRLVINNWVEEKTQNKIKELLKPGVLDSMARLVLTNAIYFKGKWQFPFKKKATRDESFQLATGEVVNTAMMWQRESFKYAEDAALQVLEMPYLDWELSLIIFLPRENKELKNIEVTFSPATVNNWLVKLHEEDILVSLPKFKNSSSFSLKDTLSIMGMPDAFYTSAADFSGMTDEYQGLNIGAVIHQAFIDVYEEGTEAAAATAGTIAEGMLQPRKAIVFNADHPFLYIIRENKTGSILFLGRLMNPKE
jgi:serpin B